MHAYIIEDNKRVPILLNLEKVVDGATFNNFIAMIIHSLIAFDGLLNMDIANKVVYFRADSVSRPRVENRCYNSTHGQT